MLKQHLNSAISQPFKSLVIEYYRIAKPVTSITKMTQRSMRKAVTFENYQTISHKEFMLMLMANNQPIYPKIRSLFLVGTQD